LDTQQAALDAQKAQLAETQRQINLSLGELKVEATVTLLSEENVWNASKEADSPLRGQTLGRDAFAGRVFVRLDLTNTGTAATQVRRAGLILDNSETVYGSPPLCEVSDFAPLEACDFPLRIEPQSIAYVDIELRQSDLACREYVEAHGIVGAVRTVNDSLLTAESGTRVSFSDDCSTLPEPAN
jgi:hypothetical protein